MDISVYANQNQDWDTIMEDDFCDPTNWSQLLDGRTVNYLVGKGPVKVTGETQHFSEDLQAKITKWKNIWKKWVYKMHEV